jgi:hypothetical protein
MDKGGSPLPWPHPPPLEDPRLAFLESTGRRGGLAGEVLLSGGARAEADAGSALHSWSVQEQGAAEVLRGRYA